MTKNKPKNSTENDLATDKKSSPPKLSVRSQYVKDLSFENPKAPLSLTKSNKPPLIQISVDVSATPLEDKHYEVALQINAKGTQEDEVVFVVELLYAGYFILENIPDDQLQPVCLVECPRILFPFARNIIADSTRDGGFPPLLLDPIDFNKLYNQQKKVKKN